VGAGVNPGAEIAIIGTERLLLTPMRVDDADELAAVLDDQRLHEFIGGRPSGVAELRARYARMIEGSSNPNEVWLNWIVRRREDAGPIGTVQATLNHHTARWAAHVAWVIGIEWQRQGFASEAARALVAWLRLRGADDVVAHIHPHHEASEIVAIRAGLYETDEVVDGERVWRADRDA
jgi:RimJ/RimL family protein N-acetyltransferase